MTLIQMEWTVPGGGEMLAVTHSAFSKSDLCSPFEAGLFAAIYNRP